MNTRLGQKDVLIGKKRDKCLSRSVMFNLNDFNIQKNPHYTKKLLHIIQKNEFRLLLSATVKMVGAYMACLIFKKVKS